MELIWAKSEAIYFRPAIWTTQITLKGLMKFEFCRSGFFPSPTRGEGKGSAPLFPRHCEQQTRSVRCSQ